MSLIFLINIISAAYVLFFPGFFLTFIFFNHGKIHIIERFALAFGLSIALVPTMVFYTSLLGIPITSFSVMVDTTGIILLTGIVLLIQHITHRK